MKMTAVPVVRFPHLWFSPPIQRRMSRVVGRCGEGEGQRQADDGEDQREQEAVEPGELHKSVNVNVHSDVWYASMWHCLLWQ